MVAWISIVGPLYLAVVFAFPASGSATPGIPTFNNSLIAPLKSSTLIDLDVLCVAKAEEGAKVHCTNIRDNIKPAVRLLDSDPPSCKFDEILPSPAGPLIAVVGSLQSMPAEQAINGCPVPGGKTVVAGCMNIPVGYLYAGDGAVVVVTNNLANEASDCNTFGENAIGLFSECPAEEINCQKSYGGINILLGRVNGSCENGKLENPPGVVLNRDLLHQFFAVQ